MSSRYKVRSQREWMELITQCRQSGLSDSEWCHINGIPASTFYNAVSRLRKKACEIPEASLATAQTLDLTARQDVVRIDIEPEQAHSREVSAAPVQSAEPIPSMMGSVQHLDNSHTIEILMPELSVRIHNQADPSLVAALMSALRRK